MRRTPAIGGRAGDTPPIGSTSAFDAEPFTTKSAAGERVGVPLVELEEILGSPKRADLAIGTRSADGKLQPPDLVHEH